MSKKVEVPKSASLTHANQLAGSKKDDFDLDLLGIDKVGVSLDFPAIES